MGTRRRSRPPAGVRAAAYGLAAVMTALLVLAPFAAGAAWVYDERRVISQVRLEAALRTFRPVDHPGRSGDVVLADLAPVKLVRSDPAACGALTVLGFDGVVGAASWTGINGRPAQPVRLIALRYADVAGARAALAEKRRAVRTCPQVVLTFPPFDQPAQSFTVESDPWAFRPGRISYALQGGERYDFYVRRFGNTLTWSFGDPEGAVVRAEVVDDLARRLAELSSG